jgi:hypothetical protein
MTLRDQILAAARARPVPHRPARDRWGDLATIALAVVGMASSLWICGGTAHAAARPLDVTFSVVGGTAVSALIATSLALPRAQSMLPRARGELIAAMAGVPLLIGLWIWLWHGAYTEPLDRLGLRCFALTALTAPWPFAALVRLRRRPDPIHPALTGGGLGAAAGAWSAVMVELWCPLASFHHVAAGHFAPLVLLVGAGAALGSRLFQSAQAEPAQFRRMP